MPTVIFDEIARIPSGFFQSALGKIADATITGWGPTVTYLITGGFGIGAGYTFSGTGMTYALIGSTRVMTGGTITSIDVINDGSPAMHLSGLSVNANQLQAAITADKSGANNAAVETLFLSLGWTYTGRATRETLLTGELSQDGALIDLRGNDTIATLGGNDDFFLGGGNDIGQGGDGSDRLDGGRGNDSLFGDAGNDTLLGGIGGDRLAGGSGNDRLIGGVGRDMLTGDGGANTFQFALRDGIDRIMDFDTAVDRIDLADGVGFSFTGTQNGTILAYGEFGDQIIFVGLDIALSGSISIL
jgi:Ca2+-binding RTX toxin-like protein